MSEIILNTTPVFTQIRKALNDPNIRGIVLEGGSRSSKSFSVGQALLVHGLENPNLTILTARQKYTWIRMSVLDTMHKVIENMGLGVKFTRSPFRLEWNGCNMTFGGLDTPQKIHGVETDIFWINEAVEATKDDFDQLEQRCKDKWIMDYNPSTDEHWIYENVLKRDDVVYIHSTVFDNPFAPENVVKKIKSYEPTEENIAAGTADDFKWEVYGLGKRSRREGVVFTNWELCKAMPTDYQWECYGIDFGFTNDPATIIRVVFADGQLWLEELCYETGMTNQDIAKRLIKLGVTQSKEIVADSAEPKSIREIKLEGFNIRGSVKGQDSIRLTIDIVKRYKLNILESSENAIKEVKNYVWQKDYSTNKFKNDKPIDDYNHILDPLRYIAEYKLGKRSSGVYVIR